MTQAFEDPDESNTPNYWVIERELLYGPEKPLNKRTEWDDHVTNEDKSELSELAIHHLKSGLEKCPALQQPRNSEFFFYCVKKADDVVKEHDFVSYTASKPQGYSAEHFGRLSTSDISECCTNSKAFKDCNYHKEYQREQND